MKYGDDIDELYRRFLAAVGREKEEIAQEVYKRGELLCMHIYWGRYRDVPLDIGKEMYHEAWLYALEQGEVRKRFDKFLATTFSYRTLGWLRREKTGRRLFPSADSDGPEEEAAAVVPDPVSTPRRLELREMLEQTQDCTRTLPARQRRTMELVREGLSYGEIGKRVSGSVKDNVLHARQNLQKCLRQRYGWQDGDFKRRS